MHRNDGHPIKHWIARAGLVSALFVTLLVIAAAGVPSVFAQGGLPPYAIGQLIVRYKTNVDDQNKVAVESRHGDNRVRDFRNIQARVVKLGGGHTVEQAIQEYEREANVAYAEPNYYLHTVAAPNDTQYPQLWGLNNTGQAVRGSAGKPGADIRVAPAWAVTTGTTSVVVGVVDTGVDYTHSDLAANIWSNPGGIAGCAAGTHGYNTITAACDPQDDNNHGTHVSGTIGALGNNGLGVVGVNWRTQIMGLKFMDSSGSGTIADAITAIDFAVNAKLAGVNVRVLSNSWGGTGFSQALLDEINKAGANGILFVVAAGNSTANVGSQPFYPCSYNTTNLICVAATDQNDNLASFSNYGSSSVHLGAPGVNILSTLPGGIYGYYSGTSMATPHVAGAAALILSAPGQGGLTVDQLKSTILNNVDPVSGLAGMTVTGGRLDVCKAIPGCNNTTPPTTTPAPTATATPTKTAPAATYTPTKTPTTTPVPVLNADYSISASPFSQSVSAGGSVNLSVTLKAISGYNSPVNLSVTGLPAGVTATFSANPVTPTAIGAGSTLSISTSATAPAGAYRLTITGKATNAASTMRSTTVMLNLVGGGGGTAGDFQITTSDRWLMMRRSSRGTLTLRLTASGGLQSPVTLSASGLPQGATATFSPNPVTPSTSGATSIMTVTAGNTSGFFSFNITGTGGGRSHSVPELLVVWGY